MSRIGERGLAMVFPPVPAFSPPPPSARPPSGAETVAATLAAGVIGASAREWTAAEAVALWREIAAEMRKSEVEA